MNKLQQQNNSKPHPKNKIQLYKPTISSIICHKTDDYISQVHINDEKRVLESNYLKKVDPAKASLGDYSSLINRTSETGFNFDRKVSPSKQRIQENNDSQRVFGMGSDTPSFKKQGIRTFFKEKQEFFDCILGRKYVNSSPRRVLKDKNNKEFSIKPFCKNDKRRKSEYVAENISYLSSYDEEFRNKSLEKEEKSQNKYKQLTPKKNNKENKNEFTHAKLIENFIPVLEREISNRNNLFERFIKKRK